MTLLVSPEPPRSTPARGATDAVLAKLAEADRLLQRERSAVRLLHLSPWLCALVPALFTADVIWHFSSLTRAALLALTVAGLAALLAWHAYLAWSHRNPLEHTARVLESRSPTLGSKLINLLQLREQALDAGLSPLTRQLAAQAVEDYADELRTIEFVPMTRTGRVRSEGKRALYGLLALLVVLGAGYDITRTELPRFFDPFGDHPPYSFTRLEITEPAADGVQVVYGQGLLFSVRATGHHPSDVFLSSYPAGLPNQITTVPMFDKGEHGFTQRIDGIKSDLIVFAQTRNGHSVSKQRRVSVILTPKLENAWVKITPPAYTGIAAEERPLQFKSLKALEGSALQFRLQSNRPLREGRLEVIKSPQEIQTITLTPSAENEVTGTLTPKDSARLRFTLFDREGHPSDETWELALNVTHDLPPEVRITSPPGDSFVAMDFKMEVIAEASDDYGVKTLRIHQARNGQFVDPKVTNYPVVTRNVRDTITLDFKQMDIESGDTFSFFAEAIDTAPEAHLARSPVVTLTVISTDEYNAFLREQMDMADIEQKYSDLFNRLHDLTDEQRKIGQQIDALKKQAEQEKNPAALAPQLDRLLAKQSELDAKLNKLAETMENTVREKPLYDIESDLQEALQKKAAEIRDSTAKNQDDDQKIGQRSSPPNGARQMDEQMAADLKKASDDQLQRLGAAEEEARKEVQQPLEDLSKLQAIMEDMNHVEELDKAQHTLQQQAKAYDKPGPLSREDQLALKDLAAAQQQVGEDLEAVEDRLWDDGKAAMDKFPKAGKSAQDLSQKMSDLRLRTLATQATDAMLAGHGDNGAQLSAHLGSELDKLFSECKSQGGQMSSELDQYLHLTRPNMKSGNSFSQMMQCHKFGNGKVGHGQAGQGGNSGSAVMMGPNAHVLGNETAVSRESTHPGEKALSHAKPVNALDGPAGVRPDALQNIPAINRESNSVQGESSFDQYGDIVDKYFKAITKPAAPKENK